MMQAMQDAEAKLAKILKPAQRTRLQQISLQMQGPFAIANNPEVASKLRVTDEQQEMIAAVMEEFQAGSQELGQARRAIFNELRQNGGGQRGEPIPKDVQAQMDGMQKQTDVFKTQAETQVLKVLTKTQRSAWQKGLGAPFDVKSITLGGRGGPGGNGRGGNNNAAANADTPAADDAAPTAKTKGAPSSKAAPTTKTADPAPAAKKSLRDRRGGTATGPSDTP